MKKVLSMLLTVALIATTLAGLFVIDASAMSGVVTPATDGTPRNITLTINDRSSTLAATGTYKLTSSAATYDVGSVTSEEVLGKTFWHYNFNPLTVTHGTYQTANYFRMNLVTSETTSAGESFNGNYAGTGMIGQASLSDATSSDYFLTLLDTGSNVSRYTFYAYSEKETGQAVSVALLDENSARINVSVAAENLYSENGVPHKVDVIWYTTDTNGSSEDDSAHVSIYIDGVFNTAATTTLSSFENNSTIGLGMWIQCGPFPSSGDSATGSIAETDLHIQYVGTEKIEAATQIVSRTDFTDEMITVPAYATGSDKETAGDARTDGFITGVSEEAAEAITTALTTSGAGDDRTVAVAGAEHLSDIITDSGSTNVTAVDRTTGEEIATTDYATTAIDDAYLVVKGIYIKPEVATSGIKEAYVESFENATGESVLSFLDAYYVSDLFKEGHNSVSVNGEALTVSYKENTYTNLAEMTDVPLNDVTFTCGSNSFTAVTYEDTSKVPFNLNGVQDGSINARIRRNDYTSENAPLSVGGLTNGFYQYTSEPRGIITFNKGNSMYNQDPGYYALGSYGTDSAGKSPYVTLSFTAYIPDHTWSSDSNYRITSCLSSAAWAFNATFVTRAADVGTARFRVPGNAWSNIRLEYDFTEAASSGKVSCDVYVNDELAGTLSKTDSGFTSKGQSLYAVRAYLPYYNSLTVLNGSKWYYGRTGSAASLGVSTAAISGTFGDVTVDETNSMLITSLGDESLISAMTGYTPVYAYEYASKADIDAAFNNVDGTITTTDTYTHSGALIKKWLLAAGFIDEDGGTTSELPTGITSVAVTGDSATMTLADTYTNTTYYDNVCTSVADLLDSDPELRTETLVGFAVTEEGKLPRIYSVVEDGVELQKLAVSSTGLGTLYFTKYGTDTDATADGMLLVASYGASGEVLNVNILDIADTIKTAESGEKTVTLQAGEVTGVSYYRAFLFDSMTSIIPLLPSVQATASN